MKISLYDRPPVFDTEGAFDDSDLLQRFEQRAMEFNRPGGFVDALRKGTAGFLRSFVAPNNIEADRLTALIGNEQERLNDPIGREMSQAQWNAHIRENAQSAANPNFLGLRSLADYIEPTPHAEPDNLLGKAAYKAGEYIPGIAGSVAEFMTLGPLGTILLNTGLGGQAAQQQVYENQLAQGKSTQEARDIAEGFLGNAADFAVRGGTNLATLWALGRAYPGFQSGISPVGHTLRNIGLASGISGAGAMGEEALTNYRSDKDNNLGNLAETGATSAATTGIIGLTLAGLRAKKLIDTQREYNAYQGLHNVEWRDITPPDTPDEPLGLGGSNNPQPPNNPPQSPNGTLALPQGTLQLPEFTTRNIAARLNKAVTQRGFNPITNDFQPNALARQIASYVGNGYMSMDDALSMLQEGGLSPDDAKGFLDTGIAEILERTRVPETPKQPTEFIIDRIANHPNTQSYRRAYEDYANLDETYSDFGGDNSNPLQDFPDTFTYSTNPENNTPTLTAWGSENQSQEQNNPLSFEEFKAAQANQNYGHQSILRSIAKNIREKLTPNVSKNPSGLMHILDPQFHGSSSETLPIIEGISDEDKAFIENLRKTNPKLAAYLESAPTDDEYEALGINKDELLSSRNEQPTTLAPQYQGIPETHLPDTQQETPRLTALGSQPQDTQQNPHADITFNEALRNVAEIIYQQHSQKPGKAYSVKPVWDFSNNLPEPVKTQVGEYIFNHRIMVNNRSTVDGYPQYFIGDLQALQDILKNSQQSAQSQPKLLSLKDYMSSSDDLLISQRNNQNLFITSNANMQTVLEAKNDEERRRLLNTLTFDELKAWIDTGLFGGGGDKYTSKDELIDDFIRRISHNEPEPQAPKLTALNDTQQPKPESGGIAEDLKNIVESSHKHEQTTEKTPELPTTPKPDTRIPHDAQPQHTLNNDPYTIDDPIAYTREDHSVEQRQIALGRAQARHFLEKPTKLQLSSVLLAPHEIAINDTQKLQGVAYELGIQNAENITDRNALIQAINNKTQELISQDTEKRRNAREQSEQTKQTQPLPIPPDAYLKKGILFFSYYPEGSKRKQYVRFTSEIIATGNGHKSIHLKNKTFGEYVYDADTGEISYRGNNPDGEKMLPTVKKEFLRQIKDFYVDRDKNSNGLPVLKKGDIAIQGRNSRLQTQDAIILRLRNLNHNDGKFDVFAVSNNGDIAGTLAHHGTFEGHSYIPPKNSHFSKEYVDQLEQLIRSELRKKLSIIPERAVIKNKNGYIDISDMAPSYGSEVRITRDNSKFFVKPHPKSRFFTFHMQNSKKKKPYAYYYPDTDSFMLEEDERDRGLLHMLEKRFREKIKDFYYGGDEDTQQPVNDSKNVTPQAETHQPHKTDELSYQNGYSEEDLKKSADAVRFTDDFRNWYVKTFIDGNDTEQGKTHTATTETTAPQAQEANPDKSQKAQEEDNSPVIKDTTFANHPSWDVTVNGQKFHVYPYGASNNEKFREWIIAPFGTQHLDETMMYDAYLDKANFTKFPDDDKKKSSNTPAAVDAIKETLTNLYREKNGETYSDKQSKPKTENNSSVRVASFNDKHENERQPEQQPQKSSEPDTASNDSSMPDTPITRLANRVKARILEALDEDNEITPFSNDDLREWATQEFGGTLGQGAFTQKQAYDAMEMGINLAIAEAGITPATAEDTHDAVNDIQRLLRILQTIPTQTNRTKEQVAFQQFSTPPTLAYLVNWLASVGSYNIALEPSAGTGNLAVFAHNAGAGLILNDYSKSGLRADILDALDWGEVYRKDALDIADILLPKLNEDERPDRVIMNPPFSAAGKQGTANSNQNGFQHVEQALQLLKDNGRLVAILGAGRDGKASSVKNWLKHVGKKYNVRALITVGGKAYQRYGTTFDNAIVVIDKTAATPKGGTMEYSFSGNFTNDEELYKLFNSFSDIVNDYKDRDVEDKFLFAQSVYEPPDDFLNEETDHEADYEPDNDSTPPKPEPPKPAPAPEPAQKTETPSSRSKRIIPEGALLKEGSFTAKGHFHREVMYKVKPAKRDYIHKIADVLEIKSGIEPPFVYIPEYDLFSSGGNSHTGEELKPYVEKAFREHLHEFYELPQKKSDIPDVIKNNPALKAIHDYLDGNTDLTLKVDEAIRASIESNFRYNLQKERQIQEAISLALGSAGFEMDENTRMTRHIYELVRNNQGYDDEHHIIATEKPKKEWEGSTHDRLKQEEATAKTAELVEKVKAAKNEQEIKAILDSVNLHSITGILEGIVGRLYRQASGITSSMNRQQVVERALNTIMDRLHGKPSSEYLLNHLEELSFFSLKEYAKDLGIDIDSLVGTRDDSEPNRAKLRIAIKKALKADTTPETTESNPVQEQENPEPVTEIKSQKYVSRKKSEQPDDNDSSEDEAPSIYSDYEPQEHSGIHLFDIAKPHPSTLVETTNMKAVHLPPLTYSPHLPDKMIESGAISESQLEAVAYAGQAFTQKLPSGQTKGFILGDGTGSGKGRTIAAIITDQLNQNHGGGKAVWFSVSADLFKDAQRDLDGIGEDKKQLFELGETKLGDTIPTAKKGIMFTTYNTLIRTGKKKNDDNNTDNDSESDKSAEGAIDTKRIKQIVDWLGEDFDGVVAFDECHKINNLGGENSGFGISAPSQSADAARKLADALPHARILYVSATSATDPNNLRMFDRSGLWGENTPFANADTFATEIKAGGPNAMEMFARDAKSLGVFVARSLSPKGLTYRRLNYKLSKTERDMYNEVAQAWRTVDDAITQGFQAVGGDPKSGKNDKGLNAKFRGRQLQCFNFLLTAFKTNALIDDAKKQLDDGNSVVIQIDSTYDAFIDRILKGKQKGDDLRDVIISPVEDLIGFVMDYFPIHKMRQVIHERPNRDKYISNEIVRDTDTNQPVVSQAALNIRNTLIAHLKRVRFNMSPLDRIINSLGGLANVAEITRRKHRLIEQANGKIIDAKQPPSANKEVDAFNNGEKRVIIFSRAGNTGRSFHADKSFKNTQRRIHYLLEGGFSAFNAIQGFGRTHRSNESSQPEYVVVAADIPGEIRFISAIVRKLGQMGALTAGDRKNNTQGLYSEKDNMESRLAAIAMNRVMGNLLAGNYPEFPDGREVIRQMGFDPDTSGEKDIPLKRIFNRVLSLDLEIQDVLISYFSMEHEQLLLMAIQNGTADIGTENIRALDCETIQDKTILEDKAKGIKTKYLELKVKVKSRIRPFQNVTRVQHCEEFFIDQEGTIYATKKNGQYETDEEGNQHFRPSFDMKNGEPIQRYTLFTTDMNTSYATDALALQNKKQNQKRIFTPVSREKAKELWQSQSASMEKSHFETIHMISGVLLPIWNQLKQLKSSRVKRVILPDGTSIIGRTLEENEVKNVLRSFRVDYEGKVYTVQDVLRELDKPKTFARLSNNWKLKYSRVSGEKRIEILYNDYHDDPILKKLGALIEIIGSDTRAFVPVGNNDVLHAVISYSEVTGFENDSSADDILDEAAQKINSNIPDNAKLYFIHPSFRAFFNNPDDNPLIHTSNYPMDSDEREYRYQKSKEADSSKSAWQHIKEFGSKVWKGRHDIPELADEKGKIDDSLIKAQELLRGLKRERQANVHETEKILRAVLLDLSPDDFDLFQRAMELRDLYETRKTDPNASMPWGLNPNLSELLSNRDPVKENYEIIMGHVRKNPRVQEAMNTADKLMEDLRKKLIEAAERLGMFDVRDRLRRKHYFRHLVLEYYNLQRSGKPHPTFKNPTARGYMKHREGSDKDISSNWILAMGEVFTRMTDDIKILDTLFKLRQEYDIIETLKQQAFQTNMNNALAEIMKGLKDVPDELRKSKAEEQLQSVLQARQARAMSRLFKLAQNGDLPIGNNNEWQEIAGRMADAGQLEKLSREEQQKLSRYIGWLSTLDDKTKARSAARSFLAGNRSKNAVLKNITGDKFVDWKDLIPDDYTLWSPSDSRLVFSASTTPEYMLKIAMDNIDELLGVNLSDLGRAIATGGNKQLWCIPERLADALDNIGKSQPMGAFRQIMTKMMGAFKQWVTISPVNGRIFKYNWRNFFGDLEAVLQGNPGALYYFNQAAKELTDVMLKGGEATGSLAEFQKRGGGLTTEAMTELERPDRIKEFSHLFEQKKSSNPLKWGVKALREYIYIATTLTNFRESILRYASFLSYIQLIKDNNGVPPFYGMSKPREVKAVGDDIYDIAFKLANENLGAYDQISSNLQWLRDNNFASFLSWVEVNTKRYARLMANVWQGNSYLEWWLKRKGQKFIDGLIGGGNGNGGNNEPPKNNNGGNFADDDGDNNLRKLFRRVAKKSGVGALRLAITLALAAPLWFMLSIWNMLNGENDEKLLPDVRNKPHLTIGTNAFTGEVMYMGDIGSAFDALQMFGVGNLITGDLRDLLDGRISFGELSMNILDGPISKLVSNANPFAKAVIEGFFGKRTFPSAMHPTPIRDKGRFIAQSFGLDWYYDFLTDKPHKTFYDFSSSVVNTANQDSSAYFYMLSRRKQFEENVLGKSVDAFTMTRRREALRNANRAADLGDGKSLRKYLREYFRAGGSKQGLKISARTMEPLYGLNDTDKMRFIAWLPKEERKILRRAMRYAERMKARLGVW